MTETEVQKGSVSHSSSDVNAISRRHAACDECRSRKLKCSGEISGCARCVKQGLRCYYSTQKQMGRPRKRRKASDGDPTVDEDMEDVIPSNGDNVIDPAIANAETLPNAIENVCPGSYAQAIKRMNQTQTRPISTQRSSFSPPTLSSDRSATTSSAANGPPTPSTNTPTNYPPDHTRWGDFSDTPLPVPVLENYERHVAENGNLPPDPDFDISHFANLPTVPACPCLPNLYLALSTLSSLSVFPINWHTLVTIEATYRTAHTVLYCDECPKQYQSASNNGMLCSTLLTILPDHFHRIRNATVSDLRRGFSESPDPDPLPSEQETLRWRIFSHYLIRAYVFGDCPVPLAPKNKTHNGTHRHPNPYPSHTLLELVEAMKRRQRQWHHLEPFSDEFPLMWASRPHVDADDYHKAGGIGAVQDCEKKDHLCLSIVDHIMRLIRSLDLPEPTS